MVKETNDAAVNAIVDERTNRTASAERIGNETAALAEQGNDTQAPGG